MNYNINEKIALLRKNNGLNKLQLAQILNPESTASDSAKITKVTRIEEAKQEISISELERLLKYFKLGMGDFFSDKRTSADDFEDDFEDEKNISYLIKVVLNNYLHSKSLPFGDSEIGGILRKKLPDSIKNNIGISDSYVVSGSAGIGQWSEVPWVAIFDKEITTSATHGIYVVILFKADMTGFYISLNQGWTYYRDKYGTKVGKEKVQQVADKLRRSISLANLKTSFENNISLKSNGNLGRGYEYGNIYASYYAMDAEFTDSKLSSSLKEFIELYKQLKLIINNRDFDKLVTDILHQEEGLFLETPEDEQQFQNSINTDNEELQTQFVKDSPKSIPEPIVNKQGNVSWARNSKVASNTLLQANYKCEYNPEHTSFISAKTGKMYCEVHHLIPMSLQGNIEIKYSLDVEANTVCLCDTCHKIVHLGIREEREKIIRKLYKDREERLAEAGILISLPLLLSYYFKGEE